MASAFEKNNLDAAPSSTMHSKDVGELTARFTFFSNEFPGDDPKEFFRRLHGRTRDRRFRYLATFLEECVHVLKQEIVALPKQDREVLPAFRDLVTIADHVKFCGSALGGAIESALLCALQLGLTIFHYEERKLEFETSKGSTAFIGLSVGLLAAAAVSASSSLAELAIIGTESVRVAFRLGVRVDTVSRSLESPEVEGKPSSWAHVVTGVTRDETQKELDSFNKSTVCLLPVHDLDCTL